MNADLTFNTVVFKKSYDLKEESLRQSVARGVNTPDKLIIKSQDYTDSVTKVPGRRYTGRVDYEYLDATLKKGVISYYFVMAIPSNAAQADVQTIATTFKAVVADATFMASILNNEK